MIRAIRPLGEQIIIKTIPKDSIGSILIPDSARGITMMGDKGAEDAVHFVEAEVIAVGPGKRSKGDPKLVDDMADLFRKLSKWVETQNDIDLAERLWNPVIHIRDTADYLLRTRLDNGCRIPLMVKPGDRILYHPSVQKFDRKVEGLGEGDFYIILENSVLAIIEAE